VIHPHRIVLGDGERRVLETGIDIAIASLDHFERPRRRATRWSGVGWKASHALSGTALRSRGRMLGVRFSGTPERLKVEIRETDRDMKAPILTIKEAVPIDRNPTFGDSEEIEATLRRWNRLLRDGIRHDEERRTRTARMIGAMVVAGGGRREALDRLSIQLPSIYRNGFHRATPEEIGRNGIEAYAPVEAAITGDGRDAIMAADATSAITSRWWNHETHKQQSRAAFDLSSVMSMTIEMPDAMEAMRILGS
jgi:hypothetical protein